MTCYIRNPNDPIHNPISFPGNDIYFAVIGGDMDLMNSEDYPENFPHPKKWTKKGINERYAFLPVTTNNEENLLNLPGNNIAITLENPLEDTIDAPILYRILTQTFKDYFEIYIDQNVRGYKKNLDKWIFDKLDILNRCYKQKDTELEKITAWELRFRLNPKFNRELTSLIGLTQAGLKDNENLIGSYVDKIIATIQGNKSVVNLCNAFITMENDLSFDFNQDIPIRVAWDYRE